jgi:hypothetical protein
MGRPLAKRFFGNRNIGTNGGYTADDGIGGEGVASAAVSGGAYTTRPVFTFTAPSLPAGVTATATVTSKAKTGAVTTAGTGYVVGDLLTLTSAGGSAIAYVATVDTGGEILSVNFSGTGASVGSFEALPGAKFPSTPTGGRSCTSNSVAGTGAEITVTFEALSTVITNSGSGYTAAPTAATGPTQSVTLGVVALTTDSGDVGSVTNQENAIIAYAYVTGNSLIADINAQKGSHRYRVTTSEGTAVCSLVAATPSAVGEMSIVATDSTGCTYYVTKLTSRNALLTRFGGGSYEFADGTMVRWTLDAPTLNTTVQIANA